MKGHSGHSDTVNSLAVLLYGDFAIGSCDVKRYGSYDKTIKNFHHKIFFILNIHIVTFKSFIEDKLKNDSF